MVNDPESMKHKKVSGTKKHQSQIDSQPARDLTEAEPPTAANGENAHGDGRDASQQFTPAPPPRFWKNPNHWIAIATVVIAVANGLYTFFALQQWTEMQTANKITKESLISVQRAFINVSSNEKSMKEECLLDSERTHTTACQFSVEWENSGTTPTKSSKARISIRVLPTDDPPDFIGPTDGLFPLTFGPRGTARSGPIAMYATDFRRQRDELVAKGQSIHVVLFGWNAYRDIFEGTPFHVTEFCRDITPAVIPHLFEAATPWAMGTCTKHNCTDRECDDYPAFYKLFN